MKELKFLKLVYKETSFLLHNKRFTIAFSVLVFIILLGLVGPILYGRDPRAMLYKAELPPSLDFPLGTDRFGRDVLAQLLYGIRTSLYVGLLVALICTSIGLLLGALAGFFGGWLDVLVDNLTNMLITIPSGVVLIIVTAYIPNRTVELLALVMSIFMWPGFARTIRGAVRSLSKSDFVMLARATNIGSFRIITEDILPHLAPYIIVNFAGFLGSGIWMETALSFLGIGALGTVSLGSLLFWAGTVDAIRRGLWWLYIPPGILITAIITSIQVIAVSLEVVFNPKLREVGLPEL